MFRNAATLRIYIPYSFARDAGARDVFVKPQRLPVSHSLETDVFAESKPDVDYYVDSLENDVEFFFCNFALSTLV